jgi:hypothetical protein
VFLKEMRQVPETQILKLTASIDPTNATQPLEPPEQLPTRENIIASFRKLGELALAGSQIYIQLAGRNLAIARIIQRLAQRNLKVAS